MFKQTPTFSVLLFALLALALQSPLASATTLWQSGSVNLLSNGDFESGNADPWILCGGAQIVDAQNQSTKVQVAHQGRFGLRIGQPIDNSCGNDALGPSQTAAEDVTIPSNASEVTLSFWYSAIGDWSAGDMSLRLGSKPTNYLGDTFFIDTIKMDELMPGWYFYRTNIKASDLAALRGKTLYFIIEVDFKGQPDWNWAIYLDDLRIVPTRERSEATGLPADLRSDGAQPIVLTGPGENANTHGIFRMDTDGSNRVRIANVDIAPRIPTWSPDGTQIAFQSDGIFPVNNPDPKKFPALISNVFLMNSDGSNLHQIYTTPGVEGIKETPLGCLRTNTCSDSGNDAIDNLLIDMDWAPDSSRILSTVCSRARWYNSDKATQDAICRLFVENVPALGTVVSVGGPQGLIDYAEGGDWFGNKIFFDAAPTLAQRAQGIWEADLSLQPIQETLLISYLTVYSGGNLDLRLSPVDEPTLSPDGRYFIVYQKAVSNHYAPVNDIVGGLRANYHIMLYDRKDLTQPRHLLLTDHGRLTGRPTWSPNGKYILYSLADDIDPSYDIWWLDVTTGNTGKVTNDGVSLNADWRPTHNMSSPTPQATVDPSLSKQVYLPVISGSRSAQPTANPTLPGPVVTFPTLTPTPMPTPLPTPVNPTAVPPRGISGRVFYKGVGVSNIKVQLEICLVGGSCDMKERTTTDANGTYNFPYAPTSNGVLAYQVTYRNGSDGGNSFDSRYLRYWQSFAILDYDYAERVDGGSFDIANIAFTAPANNATVSVPFTFRWNSRNIAGEKAQWFIDSSADLFGTCDQQTADANTSFELTTLDCGGFSPIPTGTPIEWHVDVFGSDGGSGQSQVGTVIFN